MIFRHSFYSVSNANVSTFFITAAVVQLKRVVSTSTMEHSASSSIEGLPEFLQGLLLRVVKTISLFINVEGTFTSKESPEGLESYVKSDKGSIEELPRKERVGASGSVPLMEMGGLNWFVGELIGHQYKISETLTCMHYILSWHCKDIELRVELTDIHTYFIQNF
mgnify:CR=1 FL=1